MSNALHPMAHLAQFHTRPLGPEGIRRSAVVGVTEWRRVEAIEVVKETDKEKRTALIFMASEGGALDGYQEAFLDELY